jgi:hypothetical protein
MSLTRSEAEEDMKLDAAHRQVLVYPSAVSIDWH